MEKVQKKKVSFFKKTMEVGDTSTNTWNQRDLEINMKT